MGLRGLLLVFLKFKLNISSNMDVSTSINILGLFMDIE